MQSSGFGRFGVPSTSASLPSRARCKSLRFVAAIKALFVITTFVHLADAQSYLSSTGSPSFAAPEPVELGFVDASNGNLHLSIPLGSYPQRGTSKPQSISLEYDSSIWVAVGTGGTATWSPTNSPEAPWAGWYLSFDADQNGAANDYQTQGCYIDQSWPDQNGTVHWFHLNTLNYTDSSCPTAANAFATDSSGYHMYVTGYFANGQIYAPDGTLVASWPAPADPEQHYIMTEDSNGNYLSMDHLALPSSVYDTLGREIVSQFVADQYTMMTSQGTSAYSYTTATISTKTNFNQPNVNDTTAAILVMRSLTLPDAEQSTYYFTYDCDDTNPNNPAGVCSSPGGQSGYYGELTSVTLPTGGKISYSYLTFKDTYGNMNQWVSSRSSASGDWSYTPTAGTSCNATDYYPNNVHCTQTTTVKSPTGQTVYLFQLNNGAWPATITKEDLSGHVLSTVTNSWNYSNPCVMINCHGNQFVQLQSQTITVPSSAGSLIKGTCYTYQSAQGSNIAEVQEWRYSQAAPSCSSLADRTTYISYLSTGTNNINRPTSVTLCNNSGSDSACPGGGSRVSQTEYCYDNNNTACPGAVGANLTPISGIAQHDDTNFGSGYTSRGNVTARSQWVANSSFLTTSYTYDTTGQVLTETDPAGNVTHYSYADKFVTDPGNDTPPASYTPTWSTNSWVATNAYLTSVTDAIGLQKMSYYWGSGNPAVATGYNTQSATNHYQDGLDRQTEEIDPIGWSLATYSSATEADMYTSVGDISPSVSCASCQHTQSVLDSWGRTSSQLLMNNPSGPVEVDYTYDAGGRLSTQSHVYSGMADPNHVFETFGYDALDRQISTNHPDGEASQVIYGPQITSSLGLTSQQGSTTTYGYGYPEVSEDESGNLREQWADGFGRTIEVDEPNASGSLTSSPLVTNYVYDAGDRLTQVIQGGQTRTFSYDGLGRKIYENTPEGNAISYSYTASTGYNCVGGVCKCGGDPSMVCSRTDARGVVSTYTYDNASRVTGVSYTVPGGKGIAPMPNVCTTTPNATAANVCYYYDQGGASANAIGRLTQMTDSSGSESYSYDVNGRVTQLAKVVSPQTYTIGYQYNAGGAVTQISYPSGRVVQQAYNAVGQLCEIASVATGCGDSSYYAGGFSYNTPGNLTGFNYGNGVSAAFYYSPDRMQLVYLAYTNQNSSYFNLQYSYRQSSPYSPACPGGTIGNNGSIQCISDNVDSGRSTGYGYDSLQRVASANTCGSSAFPKWGLTESFDRFGNRWSQTKTAGSPPSSSLIFGNNGLNGSTTNQPNGYTFDPSGNMTVEPLVPQQNYMTYDGENRMTAVSGSYAASYAYDGNGMRVVKSITGGTTTVSIFAGSSVIAEYDNGAAPSSPSREYVYNGAGGSTTGLLAMFSGGTTTYYHQDHLSVRLTTDGTMGSPTYGQVLSQEGHYPYGEQWYSSGSGNKWFFTNYDRDTESGLDYALARYYDSRTGTFCSADPLAGSPGDPQSWNRYPYGRNDPIDMTDPSGKDFGDFLGSLINGLFEGIAFAFGGPAGGAWAEANSYAYDGQPYLNPVTAFGGAVVVSSWSGSTTISSGGGLTNGIQAALGLPTIADVGGPILNATDSEKLDGQALDMRAEIIRNALTNTPCGPAFAAHKGANGKPFTTDSFINNLKSSLNQAPGKIDRAHPTAFAETDPTNWKIFTLKPFYKLSSPLDQAMTLFHEGTHSYFRIGDNNSNSFSNFKNFFSNQGFVGDDNHGTHDFTLWLKKGCPPHGH